MKRAFVFTVAVLILSCGCLEDVNPDVKKVADAAIKSKNPTACDGLTLKSSQESCKSQVAVGLKNPTICKSIAEKGTKDMCTMNVAAVTHNPITCFGISDTDQKAFCIAAVGVTTVEDAYRWANGTYNSLKRGL